jgi:ArsR family transcriptional regulator, arsenate/arsenite/antimonite-responsive transcriptional repressor
MSKESFLHELETLFFALADKTRLRLLNLMRDDEICVCFFTEVLGESQPKISRHLAYLRSAGLVAARRDGKWMHYSITLPENEAAAGILKETLESLRNQDDMQKDHENLYLACCGLSAPIAIEKAPKPPIFADTHMQRRESEEIETYLLWFYFRILYLEKFLRIFIRAMAASISAAVSPGKVIVFREYHQPIFIIEIPAFDEFPRIFFLFDFK